MNINASSRLLVTAILGRHRLGNADVAPVVATTGIKQHGLFLAATLLFSSLALVSLYFLLARVGRLLVCLYRLYHRVGLSFFNTAVVDFGGVEGRVIVACYGY